MSVQIQTFNEYTVVVVVVAAAVVVVVVLLQCIYIYVYIHTYIVLFPYERIYKCMLTLLCMYIKYVYIL